MPMTPPHKAKVAEIRSALKAAGISARCRGLVICGIAEVQVFAKEHGVGFGADAQRIAKIAKDAGLTSARRCEIDVAVAAQLTEKNLWQFEFHE